MIKTFSGSANSFPIVLDLALPVVETSEGNNAFAKQGLVPCPLVTFRVGTAGGGGA
jgi:hypothetical protein